MAVQSGTYRGVSAEDRRAQRRARLLEATLAVWGKPGGGRVTMTAICAEAGLTERYFYESFRNVDDALTAVLERIATEIEDTSQAAADAAGDDPTARVRASVQAFVELMADDPRKGRVAIIEAGGLASLRPLRTELLRQFAHRSAEEARELYDLGSRNPRESEIAGLLFIGGMAELIAAWLDGAIDPTTEELVDAATSMFVAINQEH